MPNSPHICIVDDDESVRESLEALMRSVGFAVNMFATETHLYESIIDFSL